MWLRLTAVLNDDGDTKPALVNMDNVVNLAGNARGDTLLLCVDGSMYPVRESMADIAEELAARSLTTRRKR